MKYLLQICHPNEVCLDAWKTVDEIDDHDDITEHLSSPTFDWYPGLVVRCIMPFDNVAPEYIGIYGESECIDVSRTSDFCRRHSINRFESLIHFWCSTNNASEMFRLLSSTIPQRQRVAVIMKILPMIQHLFTDASQARLAFECMNSIRAWLQGIDNPKLTRITSYQLNTSVVNNPQRIAARAVIAAAESLSAPTDDHKEGACAYFVGYALSIYNDTEQEDEDRKIADVIRQHVPFYDIAVAVGNS